MDRRDALKNPHMETWTKFACIDTQSACMLPSCVRDLNKIHSRGAERQTAAIMQK